MDYFSHERPRIVEVSANYDVQVGDDVIHFTTSATATLYSAVGKRREITFKRLHAAGPVSTINAVLGQTIDGVVSKDLATNFNSLTIYSFDGNWWVK